MTFSNNMNPFCEVSYLAYSTVMVALFFLVLVLNMPGGATTSVHDIRSVQTPMCTSSYVHNKDYARLRLCATTSTHDKDCT